jgi:hypothetical protein
LVLGSQTLEITSEEIMTIKGAYKSIVEVVKAALSGFLKLLDVVNKG